MHTLVSAVLLCVIVINGMEPDIVDIVVVNDFRASELEWLRIHLRVM